VSDPEYPSPFSSERGTLASLGARRRWRLFGRDGAQEEAAGDSGDEEGTLVTRSMLGSLASRSGPDREEEPERRSVLSLSGTAAERGPETADDPGVLSPLTNHSTLGTLAGLEEPAPSSFPIERGILISLVIHLLLVALFLLLPARLPVSSKGDLLTALVPVPEEKDDSPIPVIFQDAPGPAQPNPKRSPLSDADRKAGGGDPSRPKVDAPFVPPSQGVAGLAPGQKSPRVPARDTAPRSGAAADAQRPPASESAASPPGKDPSEFPQAQKRSGPQEMTRLAGLDSAIREAARGAVGGEGGAPAGSPDGGFVDSGPLSFDTTWYDWGPYAAEMVRRIKLHWDVPELARLGWKGSLTVRFFILADGKVADAKIVRGSGIPPFDFAAFQAIVKSSPFRPLPADLGSTREGVTVTFFYNMRPDSDEARAR
jgi:TonB family protein